MSSVGTSELDQTSNSQESRGSDKDEESEEIRTNFNSVSTVLQKAIKHYKREHYNHASLTQRSQTLMLLRYITDDGSLPLINRQIGDEMVQHLA